MKLIIHNKHTDTYPLIIHAQGMTNPKLADYFTKLTNIFLNTDPPPCDDIDLTVTNYKTIGSAQKSINHLRFPRFIALGDKHTNFELHHKIGIINDIMDSISTRYVLYVDSHDVLITNLDKIINLFKTFQCKMLFNTEPFFWPGNHEYNRPEIKNPRPIICPNVFNPAFEDLHGCNHTNRYLNSGVWIGETDFVKNLIAQYVCSPLNKLKFWHGGRIQGQDQIHYRHAFQNNHELIGLDYESVIFQTLKEKELIGSQTTLEQRFTLDNLEYAIRKH